MVPGRLNPRGLFQPHISSWHHFDSKLVLEQVRTRNMQGEQNHGCSQQKSPAELHLPWHCRQEHPPPSLSSLMEIGRGL